eukprot:SAG22_NODE_4918_length_1133_cov_1.346228_2_plen_137_part_01
MQCPDSGNVYTVCSQLVPPRWPAEHLFVRPQVAEGAVLTLLAIMGHSAQQVRRRRRRSKARSYSRAPTAHSAPRRLRQCLSVRSGRLSVSSTAGGKQDHLSRDRCRLVPAGDCLALPFPAVPRRVALPFCAVALTLH